MELEALYFLNYDELACSDLDVPGEALVVDSDFPYHDSRPSELEVEARAVAREAYAAQRVNAKTLRHLSVVCPVCNAPVGKLCRTVSPKESWYDREIGARRPVHQRRYNLAYGYPEERYAQSDEWRTMGEYEQAKIRYRAKLEGR